MDYKEDFQNAFLSEIRKSKPYLILGTVMYLITITVAYGILTTFEGATFSLNSSIVFTALRDYLVIPGLIILFSFVKALLKSYKKNNKKS